MKPTPRPLHRRDFLKSGALAVSGSLLASRAAAAPEPGALFSAVGIAAPLDRAAELKSAGVDFLTLSTGDFLVPDQADEVFAAHLAKLKAAPLPVLACNGFIRPAHLRCVGPEANHDLVLEWAGTDLASVFAQRGNLVRPAFLAMLRDILRFNRETTRMAREGAMPALSLGEYLDLEDYSQAFRDWYLLPDRKSVV